MNEKMNITMKEIEKKAIYSGKGKTGLSSIFAKKEEFKNNLLKIEYKWNIAGFPNEVIALIRSFLDTGTIYIIVDEKLKTSLYAYVNSIIDILEKETGRDFFLENIKKSGKTLENTLVPYFTKFSKNYESGAIIFHIVIKSMLSSLLRDKTKDRAKEFKKKLENEITRLTNSIFGFVRLKSRIPLKEKINKFLDEFLLKIPILACTIAEIDSSDLEHILLSKGFSLTLFNSLYAMLFEELKQTIEKNLLHTIFSLEIRNKNDLLKNIEIPLSKAAAEEINKTIKQSVAKRLSDLEKKKLALEREIEKSFEGFDEISKILWDSINSEIKSIKNGKNGNTLDEVTEKSGILDSFITKKIWAVRELMKRKKKLDTTISDFRRLEALNNDELVKYSSALDNVPKIEYLSNFYFAFIKHYGKTIAKLPPKILAEAEKILKFSEKKEKKEIIHQFIEKHFMSKKYFPDRFLLRFLKCFEDVIIPLYIENSLMKFFSTWPPIVITEGSKGLPFLEKEALYVGDFLIPEKKFLKMGDYPISTEKEPESKNINIITKLVDRFSRLVSVLVYDIRGSTFMGTKLSDARRESSIRKKFSNRMLKVAEKYGAFPVKDTGDGGILFFSDNSRELFGKIYAPGKIGNEWLRVRFKQEELNLKEGEEAAKMAILTAKEMMLEAQKFVSKNINEYSDWFKEEKSRELFFKGMSYAQLPPSYKKIFQIGIGIASGHLEKDIHFSINAFGDPDITGNLIRDANLYSKARNLESSVVLMDSSSLLNLLLNIEIIEPVLEEKRERGFSGTEISRYLLDKTFQFATAQTKIVAYKLKKYGLTIERIGYRILEEGKNERIIPALTISELGLEINDAGEIKDIKGGIIKFLYEISLKE
ncbi:MAG: hypothetical protein E3J87_07780 [Candidatus Cloacimonadota bacterium]|nr:MAG: hypothetical protein E3J87_07780 [Candidatus Cloacimonadota bacterium]